MKINDNSICWGINIDEIKNYFIENYTDLKERMDIICKSEYDDVDNVWWLFLTNESDCMLLSLENEDIIIDSVSLSEDPDTDSIRTAVESLLSNI